MFNVAHLLEKVADLWPKVTIFMGGKRDDQLLFNPEKIFEIVLMIFAF